MGNEVVGPLDGWGDKELRILRELLVPRRCRRDRSGEKEPLFALRSRHPRAGRKEIDRLHEGRMKDVLFVGERSPFERCCCCRQPRRFPAAGTDRRSRR